MINQHSLDWTKIKSTGKEGRILKEDVLNYIKKSEDNTSSNKDKNEVKIEINEKKSDNKKDQLASQNDKTIKISGFKMAMTKSMTISNTIPSFLYSDEYNVDNLISTRQEINKKFKGDFKLTFMPFIIKSVSLTLKEFPELNSIVNTELNSGGYIFEYTIKSDHNISIAIDGPDGLVVPNIKRVNTKSVREIQQDLYALRDRANNRILTSDDISGGTFCISNIGNIGGKQLGPVIMSPQVCIIGISRMIDTVKLVNLNTEEGKEEIKTSQLSFISNNEESKAKNVGVVFHKSINFCISADHRVIDGAYVAKFSERLKKYIEAPINILIG